MLSAVLRYVAGGLLFLSLMLGLALWAEKRHSGKLQAQVISLSAELKSLTDAKNNQKAETKTRIETVTKIVHDADGRAKVIEAAPPAPNCKTNSAVLQADI